jgi:transposase
MAKFKTYDYRQRVFLPVSLEDQLLPGTFEFAIHTLVESRLDTSGFVQRYRNDETGRSAYDPKILLKIVLLGYARGFISSRKIEQACRENVVFIALACGQQPDHSTIATFVSSMKNKILPLFRDVLLVCQEMGLLAGTFFALDGVKIPSNASAKWSGTCSELHRKKARLEAKVEQLLEEHVQEDQGNADRLRLGEMIAVEDSELRKLSQDNKRRDKILPTKSKPKGLLPRIENHSHKKTFPTASAVTDTKGVRKRVPHLPLTCPSTTWPVSKRHMQPHRLSGWGW